MAAPGSWGESSYPSYPRGHSPPEHRRVLHPYAAAPQSQRHSFHAPPVPGFYNPALSQAHVYHPSLTPGVASAPVFPEPRIGLPPSLVPGRQPTFSVPRSQSNDFFFQQNEPPPFRPPPLRYTQSQSVSGPPLPRKPDFAQPPLPPKPSFSFTQSPPISPASYPSQAFDTALYSSPELTPAFAPPVPPAPSAYTTPQPEQAIQDEDAIFKRVLEMSAQEARQSSQDPGLAEEEHLARALKESLKINPHQTSPDYSRSDITSSPDTVSPVNSMPIPDLNISSGSRPTNDWYSAQSVWATQISADEALARQLAEEEERLMKEEEEEEEEERERRQAQARSPSLSPSIPASSVVDVPSFPSPAVLSVMPADGPPQYDDAMSSPPPASNAFYSSSLSVHYGPNGLPANGSGSFVHRPGSPSQMPALGRSVSERPAPPKSYTPPQQTRPLGRSQSLAETIPTASTTHLAPTTPPARPSSSTTSELESAEQQSSASSPSDVPDSPDSMPSSQAQYLDQEILMGLTMGFGTPPIGAALKPFDGVIPNVIALPYGRCPPFHIRATSWRALLKLLARLSGSRLEPTMEAIAVVKTEMRLRVVVSFVKVHHSSSVWHTVLYMTIDHPVPSSAPTGWKYRNSDTNTLPWSYTLSPLPAFLRDGAEAPLSKFYTIPTTNDTAFPLLPISFPNLATYLASVLESSRNAMNDSSSGLRRLARCVDQFYPSDHIGVLDDAPERAGMRQRLKNLVGIGSKPQRDRNADVYELVTPFVPDHY